MEDFLLQDLESEILKRCRVHDQNPRLLDYINKSIEICWLMAVQDPPMYLYNVQRTEFDSSKFREYQRRGFYAEYIVWPALALCKNGPLLSKGVAQGSDIPYVTQRNRACYIKPTGEENTGGKGRNQTGYPSPYSSYGTNKGKIYYFFLIKIVEHNHVRFLQLERPFCVCRNEQDLLVYLFI